MASNDQTPEPQESDQEAQGRFRGPTAGEHDAAYAGRDAGKVSARVVNDTVRYAMFSVFAVKDSVDHSGVERSVLAAEVAAVLEELASQDLVVRGFYDIAGMRADADLMVWWHAPTVEVLQEAYRRVRRTRLGRHLDPVWSQACMHRPAEFNKGHVPAFMAQERAQRYVCVYPFVRSYEWYLLADEERRKILAEHGKAARGYPDVRANTVSSFALGDYEWILAFEAEELFRLVDLMRDLRATEARRHVREEIPFFTGPKVELTALVEGLP